MNDIAVALVATSVLLATAIGSDMVSEEIRGRLDRLPQIVLRLGARRLPRSIRYETLYTEWIPELREILHGRGLERLPITRLLVGLRYAAGLARSAREIGRDLGSLSARSTVPAVLPDPIGYGARTACAAAGVNLRQLDYWARTGLVPPSVKSATDSAGQGLYSFADLLILKVIKRLLDAGVSLQDIRVAVDAIRPRAVDDLRRITLLSDGTAVYECTTSAQAVDLLRGGHGVFGIAVSGAIRELSGALSKL